jgi:hypothetical protein
VTCLHDEDGDYYMGKWSSQFNLGDNPNPNATIFFELGYVDWDDFDSPFITLATATATVQELMEILHINLEPSIRQLKKIGCQLNSMQFQNHQYHCWLFSELECF